MASENVDKLLLALRDNESLMLELSAVLAKLTEVAGVDLTKEELAEFFTELSALEQREVYLALKV